MRILPINTAPYKKATSQKTISNIPPAFEGRFINGMKKPRHIKPYLAMRAWINYHPIFKDFGDYKIPVHNEEISRRLRTKYSLKDFTDLFNFTDKKGTFDYIMNDKTGFIKTSFINRKENPLMSDLIWITDTCNNIELVKHKKPNDCTKILNKLTDFYEAEKTEFDKMISEPEKYKNNPFWPNGQVGIGHCFVPQTNKPHHWFAKTRLESVGNYLQLASDQITAGFEGKNYGYKSAQEVPDKVIDAITNCVKYLKAIHYPTARSCGAWEEQTFVNSLTSDTAIVNQGMRDILKLVYSQTSNENLLNIRKRLLNSKHGDIFKDKADLKTLLKQGEYRIVESPFIETSKGNFNKKVETWEEKCLARDFDSAMNFMPQTETLSENIVIDTTQKLHFLKRLAKALVRPNGAIRYKGDEYLNLDYHTLKNPWTDNKKVNEAEWFFVSEKASAYGIIAKNIINHIKQEGSSPKSERLLELAIKGETEFINRSYARITPKNMTKSNGYYCAEYKVPEAYEAVSTKYGVKYVPGAHLLTWAESSLMKASRIFIENLQSLEK